MALAPEVIGSIVGAGSGLLNTGLNALNMGAQTKAAKELMQYQWNNFQSPKAQVAAMGAAGLNAGALLGEGKGSFASPSVAMPSSVPVQIDGVANMANYLLAKAQAKKAGVETKNIDVDTQAKKFELELSKFFAAPAKVAEITLAWKNVMLANDDHNIKEWQKVKEKYLSELTGIQKDSAAKEFANMDTVIQQENKQREENIKLTQEKQKTEKSAQSSNYASAESSKAQAALHRSNTKYQDIVNDIKESGKVFELENIIQNWRKENKINSYQYENAKFWLRRMSRLNKQLEGDDLKAKIERELDDFFWYWKDEVPNIDMPTFMIPLK